MVIYNYINFGNVVCSPKNAVTLSIKKYSDHNNKTIFAGWVVFVLITLIHPPVFSHAIICNSIQSEQWPEASVARECQQADLGSPIKMASIAPAMGGVISRHDNPINNRSLQRNDYYSGPSDLTWLLGATFFLMAITLLLLVRHNITLKVEIAERKQVQKRLRQASDKIHRLAYTDDLSGMGNRRAFHEQGEDAIKQARENNTPLSLIMMDIDHFKKVNDQFGHLVGDKAIHETAQTILKTVRCNDIHGRIGGEEFAILLPDTDAQGAIDLAERIRIEIEHSALKVDNNTIDFTASFGVAAFKQSSDDICHLLQRADKALYKAKHLGRNRVVFQ